MKPTVDQTELIVIAGAWPGITAGNHIALDSALRLYCDRFDKVHFIYLTTSPFDSSGTEFSGRVDWQHVPVVGHPTWRRFLRSVFSRLPAVTMRYVPAIPRVQQLIDRIVGSATGRVFIIIEETPLACFLPGIRSRYPDIPTVVHSHDILSKAFEDMGRLGSVPSRLAWRFELKKIEEFEKHVLSLPTQHWSITDDDAESFRRRLNIRTDGVLGVRMDLERYATVSPGEMNTVVQIGSNGVRKWTGLVRFVKIAWPLIRAELPTAKLVLAGRGSQLLNNPSDNIEGLGFVDDERDVLGRGRIFINSQSSGSGLQLKSVVAMVAGKALVSTRMAVTGVVGEDDKEFVIADSMEEMAHSIVSLIRDPERARRIGQAARDLAVRSYNTQAFLETFRPLIDTLIKEGGRRTAKQRGEGNSKCP